MIARLLLKKENNQLECFLVGMAALIPDFDMIIGLFIPFEHGVFSHTIIGGLIFTLGYALIIWIIGRNFLKEIDINFQILFILAAIGMFSHLLLDAFTFYYSFESDATHHMFFWPFWNFPIHINTLFSGATYELRVLVEVLFSLFLGIIILIYGWMIRKENPFQMFSPKHWSTHIKDSEQIDDITTPMYSLWFFNMFLLFLIILNMII